MIRSAAIVLALIAGPAAAGELTDCYNDETDTDLRYTSVEPEVLRVTDADMVEMLTHIRENESQAIAGAEVEPALRVTLIAEPSASD